MITTNLGWGRSKRQLIGESENTLKFLM
jgi:hypothetical protein